MYYPIDEKAFISSFSGEFKGIDDKQAILLKVFVNQINKAYKQGRQDQAEAQKQVSNM